MYFRGGEQQATKVRKSQQINMVITDCGINGCDSVSRALNLWRFGDVYSHYHSSHSSESLVFIKALVRQADRWINTVDECFITSQKGTWCDCIQL